MNSLSWMLYWADFCSSLDGTLGFVSVIAGIGSGIGIFAYFMLGSIGTVDKDEDCKTLQKMVGGGLRWFGSTFVVLVLLNAILPNKDTIYAIAASEVGEKVLKSDTASKAQLALDAWLDKQIGNNKPEK